MRVLVTGLNHKSAAIEVREKLAFDGPRYDEGLKRFRALPGINEAVILSTCNRVEMYASVADPVQASVEIKEFISAFHGIEPGLLNDALYFHHDSDAIRHLFRVASSLDSMVVGEPQILGQLKDAFQFSLERKTTGALMNRLMKKAISVAKRVRTETRIAENAVSISFAAVELARKIFTDMEHKSAILLGAGEMAELAARHLLNAGVRELVIANRTYERGLALAKEINGRAVRFEDFLNEMRDTDIVVCSTGAPEYVVTKAQMQSVMKARKQRQVFMIDISVPRNLDPAINDMPNVFLYDVDDLKGVVDGNIEERQKEAGRAERIIDDEIETFLRWQSSLDAVPTIVALREHAEAMRDGELAKLLKKLPELNEAQQKAIGQMASAITNKLIHPPTAALKHDTEDSDALIDTIKRLYDI